MDPIIEVRDLSEKNRQPDKIFSTNVEINNTGHKMWYPSETHTRYHLVRKLGEDVGGLMYFLLRLPGLYSIYLTSYSISVALKHDVDPRDWSPTIDKMVELTIKSLAKKQRKGSLKIQIESCSGDPATRWFIDPSHKFLTGTSHNRFWRPIRTMSLKYLREMGFPWTKIIPPILKIPGVEEVESLYNAFSLEIGEVYIPHWDIIQERVLDILSEASHKNVAFKLAKR